MLLVKPGFSPTRLLVAASLSCASVMVVPTPAAAACQAGQAGCVLPVGQTAAPPPMETTTTTTTPVYEDEGGKKSWLPLLLGVLALGALAYFLIFDDDDDSESP